MFVYPVLKDGFRLVRRGAVRKGDLLWDFVNSKWIPVTKRQIGIGWNIEHFVAVARKIKEPA